MHKMPRQVKMTTIPRMDHLQTYHLLHILQLYYTSLPGLRLLLYWAA